jgi:glycogen operon protein
MWVTPAAQQVRPEDWADPGMNCFGMLIDGRAETRHNGDAAALLLILNSHHENVPFTLPEAAFGSKWSLLVDTHRTGPEDPQELKVCDLYDVAARSFLVFLLRTDSKS